MVDDVVVVVVVVDDDDTKGSVDIDGAAVVISEGQS